MQYRTDKKTNTDLSMLGMGCMRFPMDKKKCESLLLAAIEGGINFFDTAYIYPNSEATLGAVLAKHSKRKQVYIATKLPISMCKKYEDFDRLFNEQLKRLQTDYIDYYFMHSLVTFEQWEKVQALGVEKWLAEKLASGQIRRVGFSYHGSATDFTKVLNSYDWQFCMIQYNYYDENYQAGRSGLLAAAEKGLAIMVMEPLLGGKLATGLPKKAAQIFQEASSPPRTPADWALRWLWNQDEVTVVLSGMSGEGVMEENLRSAADFQPLSETELAVYHEVKEVFRESFKIPCTGCNYCLPCPQGINIPARLSSYNASYAQGYLTGIITYVTGIGALTDAPILLDKCTSCGVCEKKCPQHIPIAQDLKKVARRMEPLPLRAILKVVKFFLR